MDGRILFSLRFFPRKELWLSNQKAIIVNPFNVLNRMHGGCNKYKAQEGLESLATNMVTGDELDRSLGPSILQFTKYVVPCEWVRPPSTIERQLLQFGCKKKVLQ